MINLKQITKWRKHDVSMAFYICFMHLFEKVYKPIIIIIPGGNCFALVQLFSVQKERKRTTARKGTIPTHIQNNTNTKKTQ